MSAWGHRLRPASESEAKYGCSSCRGERKPAVCALEYQYVTGRAGRVSSARKPRCKEHAYRAALKYDLMPEFLLLRHHGWPLVKWSEREAFWNRLIGAVDTIEESGP